MKNIGFIGAGKVGTSLGIYLENLFDVEIAGYYSKTFESAQYAAALTKSTAYDEIDKLLVNCNILIITTPDDAIASTWSKIKNFNIQNKVICHCSGALSSEIFFDISLTGAHGCSVHPMLAVSSKENSYKDFKSAFFTLEGDSFAVDIFKEIFEQTANPYKVLTNHDKTKYHIASVFLSNFVVSLSSISVKLLSEYGFDEEEALLALHSLASNNLESVFSNGFISSLTGPIERNDISTVENHIHKLENDPMDKKLYSLLGLEATKLAMIKNDNRDYGPIQKLLENGGN